MSGRSERIAVEVAIVAAPPGKDAVLLDHEGDRQWVPRSLIDDGRLIDRDDEDDEELVELQIAAWKLRDLGWD